MDQWYQRLLIEKEDLLAPAVGSIYNQLSHVCSLYMRYFTEPMIRCHKASMANIIANQLRLSLHDKSICCDITFQVSQNVQQWDHYPLRITVLYSMLFTKMNWCSSAYSILTSEDSLTNPLMSGFTVYLTEITIFHSASFKTSQHDDEFTAQINICLHYWIVIATQ